MRCITPAVLVFGLGCASFAYCQQAGNAVQKPNLPPRIDAQWVKAERAVTTAREKYLKDVQKTLDDFAKQIERLDPQIDGKELCQQFKAVVLPDAPEVVAPVFGPGFLVAPNGHKYKLFEDNLSWHEAKKKCEEEGGYLWVIDDPNEYAFIRQALGQAHQPGNDHFWLGGTKNENGGWVWLNGRAIPNIGWEAHFPVGDGGKDVLAMNGGGKLINERPHNRPGMRFICEWDR
jgi:hypothetical protein